MTLGHILLQEYEHFPPEMGHWHKEGGSVGKNPEA